MIAKSKASEVGPAAGTYVKLQDAYFTEANKVAGAVSIGYTLPGKEDDPKTDASSKSKTNNFLYQVVSTDTTTAIFSIDNKVALNDCVAHNTAGTGTWKVTSTVTSAVLKHSAVVTGNDCKALTPTFDKIGTYESVAQ